ncbi:MAG: hypothetical protein ACOX5Z_11465 [Desulfobulbus sp.]
MERTGSLDSTIRKGMHCTLSRLRVKAGTSIFSIKEAHHAGRGNQRESA